jgi:hypothetical protein
LKPISLIANPCCNCRSNCQEEDNVIDHPTVNRRDMLLVASSMLGAGVLFAMPARAQTQTPAAPKSENNIPSSTDDLNEPYASPSRGRRAS